MVLLNRLYKLCKLSVIITLFAVTAVQIVL